jgi:uncharacterized protein YutE (UPF0331/DUF86 family)
MDEDLGELASRIRQELSELKHVLERMSEAWKRARNSNDDFYLDSVALNLHGFYSGLERMFSLIAEIVDGSMPQGENWHQLLLQQMSTERTRVRPAVISEAVSKGLNEFRGFRNVVRNVYTYQFDPVKVEKLVQSAPQVFAQIHAELSAFAAFLESRN